MDALALRKVKHELRDDNFYDTVAIKTRHDL